MERIQQTTAITNERLHVQKIRTEIEDGVVLTQTKIMNRARIFEGETFAKNKTRAGVEAIKIQRRFVRTKGDSKVEQLSRRAIHLRMRGEWTDVVECSTKVEFSARLECARVKFDRQSLFTERQQRFSIRIDAHIDRRFEHHSTLQTVRIKRRPESTAERATGLFLRLMLRASNKAAYKLNPVVVEVQRANHPIAVKPVVVTETFARRSEEHTSELQS